MCSIVFFYFQNKICNTYRDLHTRIILNNVLKVTFGIVENVRIVGSETFHIPKSLPSGPLHEIDEIFMSMT